MERGQKKRRTKRKPYVQADPGREQRAMEMARACVPYADIGAALGCSESTVQRIMTRNGFKSPKAGRRSTLPATRITKAGEVRLSNKPLREAVDVSDVGLPAIAVAVGFTQARMDRPLVQEKDTTRLRRVLGYGPTHGRRQSDGTRTTYYQTTISLEFAEQICQAIGVDFDSLYADQIPEREPAGSCKQCGAEMRKASPGKLCGLCLEERNPVPSALAEELAAWKLDEQAAA